jgi:hypothetical protein
MMEAAMPRWRFAFSPNLKLIYLCRYGLFSGGCAIAGAMLQRMLTDPPRAGLGLILGWVLGLYLFRGQLRPFRFFELALAQEQLFLVRRKKAWTIPWNKVASLEPSHQGVALKLTEPLPLPAGNPSTTVALRGRELGVSAALLADAVGQAWAGGRSELPADEQVRRLLKLEG